MSDSELFLFRLQIGSCFCSVHRLGAGSVPFTDWELFLFRSQIGSCFCSVHRLGDVSVPFTDWESLPSPKAEKPIAYLSTAGRPRELAGVFESFESREYLNWHGTRPLFSVSFIDPGELKEKLAEVRINPEEASQTR